MIQIVETSEATEKAEVVTEMKKKISDLEDSLEKHIEASLANSSGAVSIASTVESEPMVDTTDSSDEEEDDDGDW
jgi:hypothetical protein